MEIVAEDIEVRGPSGQLLAPTSLRIHSGQLLLIAGDQALARTALALVLSGRLRPTSGRVRIGKSTRRRAVRRHTAVIDAPEVTEPDGALQVQHVVAEALCLADRPSNPRYVRKWMERHNFSDHRGERFEHLPAAERTRLLVQLACESRSVQALVLDSPDRHEGDPSDWYRLAAERSEAGMTVAVLCSPHSAEKLNVPFARIGTDNRPDPQSSPETDQPSSPEPAESA